MNLLSRFMTKVNIPSLYACWEWTGSRNWGGYGRIGIEEVNKLAHRVAWKLAYGRIPEGMKVLHKCDNPPCVNPLHLFLGTQLDNNKDCAKKGRHVSWQLRNTHCPQGHEYAGDNLKVNKKGWRICRVCYNTSCRKWYHKNKTKERLS